ncbi:unnamed protein product [Adineta ricciae]|uniref:DJ-1/PfpI domain-containing protein n=1 Tax=Adineta ricciae TaxID=249248 RepID=A0A815RL44_ADIRI|nr:unnamed protein product [Adineta ricciae]CAF1479177.1 unnamed protein product [Adineta ricciae]
MTTKPLQVGILLFKSYQLLDATGPLDLLTMLTPEYIQKAGAPPSLASKAVPMNFHYISDSLDPVAPAAGPLQLPTCTYTTCPSLDLFLLPGPPPDVEFAPELIQFIQKHVQEADIVMSICTGSIVLAAAGVLNGKKASTNKNVHKFAIQNFPQTQWTEKGRWIVCDKFWTSSGVTAGMDMMAAFLMSRYDQELVKWTYQLSEFVPKQQDDDPFTWILEEAKNHNKLEFHFTYQLHHHFKRISNKGEVNYQVEQFNINCSQILMNMTITITIVRNYNETYAQQYQTYWNSSTDMTHVQKPFNLTYHWFSISNMYITRETFPNFIEAQFYYSSNSIRVTNNGTWEMSAQTISGELLHFRGTF